MKKTSKPARRNSARTKAGKPLPRRVASRGPSNAEACPEGREVPAAPRRARSGTSSSDSAGRWRRPSPSCARSPRDQPDFRPHERSSSAMRLIHTFTFENHGLLEGSKGDLKIPPRLPGASRDARRGDRRLRAGCEEGDRRDRGDPGLPPLGDGQLLHGPREDGADSGDRPLLVPVSRLDPPPRAALRVRPHGGGTRAIDLRSHRRRSLEVTPDLIEPGSKSRFETWKAVTLHSPTVWLSSRKTEKPPRSSRIVVTSPDF